MDIQPRQNRLIGLSHPLKTMLSKALGAVLGAALPLSVAFSGPAAALSLEQVRYALYQDPAAPVTGALEQLAADGDTGAMLMLANRLLQTETDDSTRIIALYKQAFDDGRGEMAALSGLVRLVEMYPHLQSSQRSYFERALRLYSHDRDLASVAATLDVSLLYPELVADKATLLALYGAACVENCKTAYFAAVHAAHNGDTELALARFRDAMSYEPKAVERYYQALNETDRDNLFRRFADDLKTATPPVSAEVALATGKVLDRIADIKRVDEQLAELARRAAEERAIAQALARGEPAPEKSQAVPEKNEATTDELARAQPESEQIRAEGQYWIDQAVSAGLLDAMISQLYSMTSSPESYSGDEAFALIRDIERQDPLQGRRLRVAALMVIDWPTLDPEAAHKLIQQMIAEGDAQGELLLADLYSRGGLDEPDQQRALTLLKQLADKGERTAMHRMAGIYTYGRAICRDYEQGYRYALITLGMGGQRAMSIVRFLEGQLDSDTIKRVKQESARYLKDLESL
ncbi:hypothetical protein KJI95_11245 [Shewanella sp. JM162201]|uniref:Sel1 repeat protein n=1 Tax=Shewanella jiangmenensis TaxID=2837387 RepID=A0ABS5V3U9_9GAMM|nr:hypothetical protein [Shewanella jiangmenensis]MBT1445095.1 hypothetical protein [Shewanella jiangmenensis]